MSNSTNRLVPLPDRGPLRVMFVITSMVVGGAETLLVNLVRRLDRSRVIPELCCLKDKGPLGEILSDELTVHANMLSGKYDVRVLSRLTRLMKKQRIDAMITVGAGDKMFWGRLAAWRAGVPVVCSALHSTGWPDGVSRLNRTLTPITDGFIGCATAHGHHLVEREKFPKEKVFVIPNGIDTQRFSPLGNAAGSTSREDLLGIDSSVPLTVIVAALRPEKNHSVYLQAAAKVRESLPNAEFLIVGDGDERPRLESEAQSLGIDSSVHFLGTRSDTDAILRVCDAFALTSDNEAAPVSIMEAMSSGLPVVATEVGSVPEMVIHGETGYLAPTQDVEQIAQHLVSVLGDRNAAQVMGTTGRKHVQENASLEVMVNGYEDLVETLYQRKIGGPKLTTYRGEAETIEEVEEVATVVR